MQLLSAQQLHSVLVDGVAQQEQAEEEEQGPEDEPALLALRHAVGAYPVLLVLRKARNGLRPRLEGPLLRAARRALPILRQILRRGGNEARLSSSETTNNARCSLVSETITKTEARGSQKSACHITACRRIVLFRTYIRAQILALLLLPHAALYVQTATLALTKHRRRWYFIEDSGAILHGKEALPLLVAI